jgi:hypothetical protein
VAVTDMYFAQTKAGAFGVGQFDDIKDIVNVAMSLEIIERKGSSYQFGGQKWIGKEKVFEGVREDIGLQNELRAAAFDMVLQGKGGLGSEDDEDWVAEDDTDGA